MGPPCGRRLGISVSLYDEILLGFVAVVFMMVAKAKPPYLIRLVVVVVMGFDIQGTAHLARSLFDFAQPYSPCRCLPALKFDQLPKGHLLTLDLIFRRQSPHLRLPIRILGRDALLVPLQPSIDSAPLWWRLAL